MKKRVLAGILMLVMVMASVMGVSAANSKEVEIYVTESQSGYYEVVRGEKEFADLKNADAAMYDLVTGFNNKKVAQDKVFEGASDAVKNGVKDKELLWKIFDLIAVGGGNPKTDGTHEVTLAVPMLTKAMTDVVVVRYSEANKAWEVITSSVDYDKKTVTISTKDLCPIAIYVKNTGSSASGTSPSTEGVSSAWMIWSAAALILLGAGVVVSQKKKF